MKKDQEMTNPKKRKKRGESSGVLKLEESGGAAPAPPPAGAWGRCAGLDREIPQALPRNKKSKREQVNTISEA